MVWCHSTAPKNCGSEEFSLILNSARPPSGPLEKQFATRQGFSESMKRLLTITCVFLVFLAAAASAWASCKQISFAQDKHHASETPAHRHDHHPGSDHQHSRGTVIHCPTVKEFVPVATFSLSKELRVERLLLPTFLANLDSQLTSREFDRLIHGPPRLGHASAIPPYLPLSILRI